MTEWVLTYFSVTLNSMLTLCTSLDSRSSDVLCWHVPILAVKRKSFAVFCKQASSYSHLQIVSSENGTAQQTPMSGHHQLRVDEGSWCEERELMLVGRYLQAGAVLCCSRESCFGVLTPKHSIFIAVFGQSDECLRTQVK